MKVITLGAPGDYGCLKQVACQDPQQAQKYVMAGNAVLKASKMLSLEPDHVYEIALKELDEATNSGANGNDCLQYKCGRNEDTLENRT